MTIEERLARRAAEEDEADAVEQVPETCLNPVCRRAYALLDENTERLNTLVALCEVWCERNGGRVTVMLEDEHKPIFMRGEGLAMQLTQEKGQFVARMKLVEDLNLKRRIADAESQGTHGAVDSDEPHDEDERGGGSGLVDPSGRAVASVPVTEGSDKDAAS